jgi:hypothetical protein
LKKQRPNPLLVLATNSRLDYTNLLMTHCFGADWVSHI